jgi:hypothetical protein
LKKKIDFLLKKNSERGTKCPLCKNSIKFIDIKKLPKEQRYRYEPQAWKRFREKLKVVKFQQAQQSNLAKLAYQFVSTSFMALILS